MFQESVGRQVAIDEIPMALDMCFGAAHLNIRSNGLAMCDYILDTVLQEPGGEQLCVAPRGECLARLMCHLIVAIAHWESLHMASTTKEDEATTKPAKMQKMNADVPIEDGRFDQLIGKKY